MIQQFLHHPSTASMEKEDVKKKTMSMSEVKEQRHAEGQQTDRDLSGRKGKHLTGDTTG